jgi:hypothetical protein
MGFLCDCAWDWSRHGVAVRIYQVWNLETNCIEDIVRCYDLYVHT